MYQRLDSLVFIQKNTEQKWIIKYKKTNQKNFSLPLLLLYKVHLQQPVETNPIEKLGTKQ